MKWGQIKTLFILTFFVLNIYLFIQFYEKRQQADIGILEREESTIEEQLETESITISASLPKEQDKEPFISVGQKTFSEEDMKKFNQMDKQTVELVNKNYIVSLFNQPINVPTHASRNKIEELFANEFIFPENYSLWNWNKDLNVLVFFQEVRDRPIYYNYNGLILVFLDDNNDALFYRQTMLGESDARQDKKSLIKPIKAIETLYDSNELHQGDNITKVDIGFHTRVPLENGVQVFVPAWKVTVNDERNYFVNAIEGFIFYSDELKFLEETMSADIGLLRDEWNDDPEIKTWLVDFLNDKIEAINRGGIE